MTNDPNDPNRIVVTPATPVAPVVPVAPAAPAAAVAPVAAPVAPVVAAQPVQAVVVPGETATSVRSFAPDSVIAAVVGLVLTVIGLIAVTRAGIDEPIDEPLVDVLGFGHTATLGVIEIAIGVGLLFSGAFRSRGGAIFFGAILGIAGFVAAVQTDSFDESLGIESSFAWILVAAGAVVVLAALLVPRTTTRTQTVSRV